LSLKRSTAPYSEGLREWLALPGVDGGKLDREGDDAIEDVEVDGEGGFVDMTLESIVVITLGGFLCRCEILCFLE
jgi:hypothetical protein